MKSKLEQKLNKKYNVTLIKMINIADKFYPMKKEEKKH